MVTQGKSVVPLSSICSSDASPQNVASVFSPTIVTRAIPLLVVKFRMCRSYFGISKTLRSILNASSCMLATPPEPFTPKSTADRLLDMSLATIGVIPCSLSICFARLTVTSSMPGSATIVTCFVKETFSCLKSCRCGTG